MCLNINLLDVKLTYLRNIDKKKIFGEYEYKHVITQKRKKRFKRQEKNSQEIRGRTISSHRYTNSYPHKKKQKKEWRP